MGPREVHKPVESNWKLCQSFLDSKWCGKIEKVEIWRDGEGPEWFSDPNIIEILLYKVTCVYVCMFVR